jgi:hypothetical protein
MKIDIHCVTRWSKFDTVWEGVHLKDLIDQGFIRLKPEATFVMQHCEYGFTVNVPLEVALSDVFLMATHFDGQPLDPDHGYARRGGRCCQPAFRNDRYFWYDRCATWNSCHPIGVLGKPAIHDTTSGRRTFLVVKPPEFDPPGGVFFSCVVFTCCRNRSSGTVDRCIPQHR